MALGVHNFTDLVNLQTICKSTDLQVYKSRDPPCQNMDFVFAFSIPGKSQSSALNTVAVVTCKPEDQWSCKRSPSWPSKAQNLENI